MKEEAVVYVIEIGGSVSPSSIFKYERERALHKIRVGCVEVVTDESLARLYTFMPSEKIVTKWPKRGAACVSSPEEHCAL